MTEISKRQLQRQMTTVYGVEEAHGILQTILDAFEYANEAMPLKDEISVQLITDLESQATFSGRAIVESNVFQIVLPLRQSPEVVRRRIYSTVEHEVAHLAHAQQSSDFTQLWETHLGQAYIEGVAEFASGMSYPDTSSYYYGESSDLMFNEDAILSELRDLLFGLYDDPRVYNFVSSREGAVPQRWYVIGAYVVEKLHQTQGLSLLELMQLQLDEIKTFITHEIL